MALRTACTAWCCALLLAGCAATPPTDPAPYPVSDLPPRAEITAVPFYAQARDQCGPATLAMALRFSGVERSPDEISERVFLPGRSGSLQPEMLAAPRRFGRLSYPLDGSTRNLYRELAAGNPVIVLINSGFRLFPRWHYALLVGYDLTRGIAILRSGDRYRQEMPIADFTEAWTRAGRWAMILLPPGTMPASADTGNYLAAAAALERVSPDAAGPAYVAALQRWPHNPVALLGLGNVAYQEGRFDQAESAYRDAIANHADSGDAWNNLAQVLLEQGRYREALGAVDRALALDSRQEAYLRTLDDILLRQQRW